MLVSPRKVDDVNARSATVKNVLESTNNERTIDYN